MRLDRTRIAIAERSQIELLDLSFIVLREFFFPIVGYLMILALPFAIFNHFAIQWMTVDFVEPGPVWRYIWVLSALVYVEAPFASVFATSYLGKVTFYEEPSTNELVREVAGLSWRILWCQLILRGVLVVLFFAWWIPTEDRISSFEWMLPFICGALWLMRSLRPYINEIVLLEKSPLWSGKKEQITVGKRSSRLHGPNSGDLFGRSVGVVPVIATFGMAVFGFFWFVIATFTNDWSPGPVIVYVAIPATLWFLVAYLTVVRFLSYLDLRIRREGWEVELKMRAEANRMMDRMKPGRMALGREVVRSAE